MMTENKVTDESKDRSYFTITPRIVGLLCQDAYEYTLWCIVKEIAGEDGECYLSTSDLAVLAMQSTGKVSTGRRRLIANGLLQGEIRRDPGFQQPVWHLRIPDLWPRNIKLVGQVKTIKDRVAYKLQQKSLHQVKPSPGEEAISPHEEAISPGETKKNQEEERKEKPIPAPAGAEPSLSPGQQRVQELRDRFGADPLAVAAHCAGVQEEAEVKAWTVPAQAGGGDDLGQAMLEQWCASKRVAIDTLPSKLAGDWRRWLTNLAGKLPNTPREILIHAVSVVLDPENADFGYYRYNNPANKKFQADWTDIALELMSGGNGRGQERKSKGRRSSREGDWPEEAEQDAVWSVHGDWIIEFFEGKRAELVQEFGDDRYLNTGAYNVQVAQALGISGRQVQALVMAYERWHAVRVPALDVMTFFGEEA